MNNKKIKMIRKLKTDKLIENNPCKNDKVCQKRFFEAVSDCVQARKVIISTKQYSTDYN